MSRIFIYSDSLSWGLIPGTRQRLPFDQRWPGVLEDTLCGSGQSVRVLEDCLNGRRTVWEDPFKPGRNGQAGLAQRIESQSPLDLVILMLGTNDFQYSQPFVEAWTAAQGIAALAQTVRQAPIEPGLPVPAILIVCPPRIRAPRGPLATKFAGAEERSAGLGEAYQAIAAELNCHYFDAETATSVSPVDGIHLDVAEHRKLGFAMAGVVQSILTSESH